MTYEIQLKRKTVRRMIEDSHEIRMPGHPDWDAGWASAMAMVGTQIASDERATRIEFAEEVVRKVRERQTSGDGHRRMFMYDKKTVVCDTCLLHWPCMFEQGRAAVLSVVEVIEPTGRD